VNDLRQRRDGRKPVHVSRSSSLGVSGGGKDQALFRVRQTLPDRIGRTTLERRNAGIGGSVAALPQVMATVKSTNANLNIRKKSTQAISNRTIYTEGLSAGWKPN
jgi:hypothetical protein